jgi:anti-sigma B factor antagonist
VTGELDLASAAAFLGHLQRATDGSRNIVLDLSGLQYIDSSGINTLFDAQRRFVVTGQRIVLAAVSPRIERIFLIIAMEQVIPLFPTVDAALASFGDGTKPE